MFDNDYTLFVDESGQAGIEKIRGSETRGASPYMTMGAVLIPKHSLLNVVNKLKMIENQVGKAGLHCVDLKHYELLHFAKSIAFEKMRLFGVISKKSTLGTYKSAIHGSGKKYYNKCAQYLLERVGLFMESRGISPHQLNIIFERANVDYKGLENLIRSCQDRPIQRNSEKLRFISADRIYDIPKNDHEALWVADLVSHSLYKCVDQQPKNFGICEPRYLRELSHRFFGNPKTNTVLGSGIYCVHSLADVDLDTDVAELFRSFKADPAPDRV